MTLASLVSVPQSATVVARLTVIVAEPLTGIVPRSQLTTPMVPEQVPCDGVSVQVPLGRVSVTTTFVAATSPVFVTVTV